jgi:hypothetical protein
MDTDDIEFRTPRWPWQLVAAIGLGAIVLCGQLVLMSRTLDHAPRSDDAMSIVAVTIQTVLVLGLAGHLRAARWLVIIRGFAGPVLDWYYLNEAADRAGGMDYLPQPARLASTLLIPMGIASFLAAVFLMAPSVGEAFKKRIQT